MDLKKLALDYFKSFSNKDIQNLKVFFSDDICLRDWEIEAKGVHDVIKANEKIFASVSSIQVNPEKIYELGNTIIAELNIIVNQSEKLLVVDIIDFNNKYKICSIKAFKG